MYQLGLELQRGPVSLEAVQYDLNPSERVAVLQCTPTRYKGLRIQTPMLIVMLFFGTVTDQKLRKTLTKYR